MRASAAATSSLETSFDKIVLGLTAGGLSTPSCRKLRDWVFRVCFDEAPLRSVFSAGSTADRTAGADDALASRRRIKRVASPLI